MIEGSSLAQRAASNRLRRYEQEFHDRLMGTATCYWPESLQDAVSIKVKDEGLCGDVIAAAVADWVAHRQPVDARPAETPRALETRIANYLANTGLHNVELMGREMLIECRAEIGTLRDQLAAEQRWKAAVIDAAVTNWTYRAAHEDDPRAAVALLIAQIQLEACDPAISMPAAEWQAKLTAAQAQTARLRAGLAKVMSKWTLSANELKQSAERDRAVSSRGLAEPKEVEARTLHACIAHLAAALLAETE